MPAGTGRTIEHLDIYYFADEAMGEGCAELREANTQQWRGIFEEDRFVVEGMQRGRASPAYKGGVLSPVLERTTPLLLPLGGAADDGGGRDQRRSVSGSASGQISQASPLQPCFSRPNRARTGGR